jgi:hypothetical protein
MIPTTQFKKMNTLSDTEDNVYYNVSLSNPLDAPLPIKADYSSNRVVPILETPSDYEVSVIRFNIPANFPLFIWPTEIADAYQIQLEWNGSVVTKNLTYVEPCTGCLYENGIYHYQTLLDILNDKLEEARLELKVLDPSFPSTQKIFFYFNPASGLFELYTEASYGANPLFELRMNANLFLGFFGTFASEGVFTGSGSGYIKFLIKNYTINNVNIGATTYIKTIQEEPSLSNWTQFSLLAFETSIPVSGELEANDKNVKNTVLTDFSLTGISNRDYISFYPQGPLRYYDLRSEYPLTNVDLRVFVLYPNGVRYPLYLNRGDTLTAKLHFRKKGSDILPPEEQ